jgi:hypothetical protein
MKNVIAVLIVLFSCYFTTLAQIDPALLRHTPYDSLKQTMNMDAVFSRPFMDTGKLPVSVGGYMEVNWQHTGTDGVSEGHQIQFRRLTLFVSSTINKRLKFLSEIEFEDGGKEIAVEFAALDIELHPLLNIRGGMIVNPIGAFNQNHDGPKWEFTDRPLSATQLLPATWSNAGFGLYGKHYSNDWMFGYEAYLSGNFDNSIIDNDQNRTFLPSAKNNPDRFEELNSGLPLFTGKVAVKNSKIGEIGFSYEGGVYNKFQDDGLQLDHRRQVNIFVIDFNSTLPGLNTSLTGEFAFIRVDVPSEYTQQYGNKQHGGFIDIVQPVLKKRIWGWENATLNLACRFEFVDWNVGQFKETGGNIGDDLWSIMPAVSFRPTSQTVFRLNYRTQQQRDILGNPPARTGGFIFGISTYF